MDGWDYGNRKKAQGRIWKIEKMKGAECKNNFD